MGCLDCSATALKLQRVDDAEDTADIIDDAVARALLQTPRNAEECIALLDIVVQGLVSEQRSRSDDADVKGLQSVRRFLASLKND